MSAYCIFLDNGSFCISMSRLYLPLRNIPQDVPLLCQLLLTGKIRKVPHQSTMSCGPRTVWQANKCSDNRAKKKRRKIPQKQVHVHNSKQNIQTEGLHII